TARIHPSAARITRTPAPLPCLLPGLSLLLPVLKNMVFPWKAIHTPIALTRRCLMPDKRVSQPDSPDLSALSPNGVPVPEQAEVAPDPFDIESLRLPQDFSALMGLEPVLTTVEVRSPSKEWWIRVHPNPDYHFPT